MPQPTDLSSRVNPELSSRRYLTDTAVRGGLAVVLYAVFPAFSDIHRLWERQAGLVPGWPFGVFEYPPIGALYFAPFRLLPSGRGAVVVNGVVMVAAAVAITWLLTRMTEGSDPHGVDLQMWVGSPALLFLLPINWDVLVALISLLGVVALYRSRAVLSGFWHGVGTVFKVFPGAVVLPVVPLIDGWRRRVMFLASGSVVLVASYLAYAVVDPDGWRFHLDFASIRTDIDSTVWGVADSIVRMFGAGLPMSTVNTMSTIAIVVALLAVTYWTARSKVTPVEAAAVALMALMAFNKVFKPQYVLWVLPFLAWIRVSRLKVRILEATAILQFAVIYFALPAFLFVVEASVRLVVLALLAAEIIKVRSVTSVSREP